MSSQGEINENHAIRFIQTFEHCEPPKLLLLSGGEPLLRPALVQKLAKLAALYGTKTYLISGMFFARSGSIPQSIKSALLHVHHVCASIDRYHEADVSREDVFRALEELRANGLDVSIQSVTVGENDEYLAKLMQEVKTRFDAQVPIFYLLLKSLGRARGWHEQDRTPIAVPSISPCKVAGWPVVTFSGAIAACCNQTVVDGPIPSHLLLGDIATDTWGDIRQRVLTSPYLRSVSLWGPNSVAKIIDSNVCSRQCRTCVSMKLSERADNVLEAALARPQARILQEYIRDQSQAAGAYGFGKDDGEFLEWGAV